MEKNSLSTLLKWLLIVSISAFVALSIAVGTCLIIEMANDNGGQPSYSDQGGDSSSKKPSKNTADTSDDGSVQAGIVTKNPLYQTKPSKTNYVSTSDSNTKDASEAISSKSTILVEVGANLSVAEKKPDLRIYPASMTKVMTLLVVCENITSLDTKLEVTQDALTYMAQTGGSGVGLKVGERLTVKDYIYLLSYQSDTIAAILLAEHVGGTQENFVKMMNDTAQKIGMANSHFANPTGLHDENNYTTCRDMAALMIYALDNPMAKEALTEYHGYALDRDDNAGFPDITLYSHWYSDRFKDNPNLTTSKILGGKTGFEDISGYTLVTYAKGDNGKYYVNVIVTRDTMDGLSLNKTAHMSEVKKMYNTYVK